MMEKGGWVGRIRDLENWSNPFIISGKFNNFTITFQIPKKNFLNNHLFNYCVIICMYLRAVNAQNALHFTVFSKKKFLQVLMFLR